MKSNGRPYNKDLKCLICNEEVFARLLCKKHYYRQYRKDRSALPESRKNTSSPCAVTQCGHRTLHPSGLCKNHADRARNWGMTPDDLASVLNDASCEICESTQKLCLDHNHVNSCDHPKDRGCIDCLRAVLCSSCNSALGLMQDDVTRLQAAIQYLQKYNG